MNIPHITVPARLVDTVVFTVAVALDLTIKEPPQQLHPVQAMGHMASLLERTVLQGDHLKARGLIAWLIGAVGVVNVARALSKTSWPVRALALWTMLSFGMLVDEVKQVHDALGVSLGEGRAQVARLVSRPTEELTESEVSAAAIETLSENLSDGVIAPAFWWAVAGLPGAMLYKYANTLDSRWGYQTPYWKDRGMVAATIDDVLSIIPARLTAIAISPDIDAIAQEAKKTPSPNAGWPMGAMALTLNKRLTKPGVYTLNEQAQEPTRKDIAKAIPYVARAGIIGLSVCAMIRLVRR